jgi:hypothetical protein
VENPKYKPFELLYDALWSRTVYNWTGPVKDLAVIAKQKKTDNVSVQSVFIENSFLRELSVYILARNLEITRKWYERIEILRLTMQDSGMGGSISGHRAQPRWRKKSVILFVLSG